MNGEGFRDNTAIHTVDKPPKYVRDAKHALEIVASLMGFDIKQICIKDKKTGKEY